MRLFTEREYDVLSTAAPTAVWDLMARPGRWHAWAPQLRGAWRLGDPQVRAGARGAALLLGVVPVPARIVAVEPTRSWTWQVGPVRLQHSVQPVGRGSRVVFRLQGPTPVVAAYGPVVHVLLRNLAATAEADPGSR